MTVARKARKTSKAGCGCPASAKRISTKRGGFVCQSKTATRKGFRPFVKRVCK